MFLGGLKAGKNAQKCREGCQSRGQVLVVVELLPPSFPGWIQRLGLPGLWSAVMSLYNPHKPVSSLPALLSPA